MAKTAAPRMNVKLLRKIQKAILAEPNLYDQNTTINETDCGTMACIGGWAFLLSTTEDERQQYRHSGAFDLAARKLGLTDDKMKFRLFSAALSSGWPAKFRNAYLNAKTPAGRARVAVRRIDWFIKTKGAE